MKKNGKIRSRWSFLALSLTLFFIYTGLAAAGEFSDCYENVSSDGVKICYTVKDNTTGYTGEPLFLLHGGFEDSTAWKEQMDLYSEEFKVIAVDSRGHGRSLSLNNPISYELMAEDLRGLVSYLATLDKEEFPELANYYPARTGINLLGWSDGGITAMNYCIKLKEIQGMVKINKVVLFGVNVEFDGLQQKVKDTLVDSTTGEYNPNKQAYNFLYESDYRSKKRSYYPYREYGISWNEEWDVFRDEILDMWTFGPYLAPTIASPNDPLSLLGDLNILVLAAENDDVVQPYHMRKIYKRIGGRAQYLTIPGDHHAPSLENSRDPADRQYIEAFNKAVLDFLRN